MDTGSWNELRRQVNSLIGGSQSRIPRYVHKEDDLFIELIDHWELTQQCHRKTCNCKITRKKNIPQKRVVEDDFVITEVAISDRDPFTMRPLESPVVNQLCSHVYEESTILELISSSKKIKCPIVGCKNTHPIQERHLYIDIEIIDKLRKQQRQNDNDFSIICIN